MISTGFPKAGAPGFGLFSETRLISLLAFTVSHTYMHYPMAEEKNL